jgi:hypothetical protein
MKQPIDPKDIRKGDLIRVEKGNDQALEYRANEHGHTNGWGHYYLLDRPAPKVELPETPTLGWLNDEPYLLATWVDCSDSAARPPAVRPVSPTPFDDGHVKSFTEAVAVPKAALDELRKWPSGPDPAMYHLKRFLAAVDEANGGAS